MSMIFAGFMSAAKEDRLAREKSEAELEKEERERTAQTKRDEVLHGYDLDKIDHTYYAKQKAEDRVMQRKLGRVTEILDLTPEEAERIAPVVEDYEVDDIVDMFHDGRLNDRLEMDAPAGSSSSTDSNVNLGPNERGAEYVPVMQNLEASNGLPDNYLYNMVDIETGGKFNPDAKNPISSASGLTQTISTTAAELGITNVFDPYQSLDGGARYAAQNIPRLREVLGRDPTGAELYLAHQQGPGGAEALLRNPSARAVDVVKPAAVRNNFPAKKLAQMGLSNINEVTAEQFASLWTDEYRRRENRNQTFLASFSDTNTDQQTASLFSSGEGPIAPSVRAEREEETADNQITADPADTETAATTVQDTPQYNSPEDALRAALAIPADQLAPERQQARTNQRMASLGGDYPTMAVTPSDTSSEAPQSASMATPAPGPSAITTDPVQSSPRPSTRPEGLGMPGRPDVVAPGDRDSYQVAEAEARVRRPLIGPPSADMDQWIGKPVAALDQFKTTPQYDRLSQRDKDAFEALRQIQVAEEAEDTLAEYGTMPTEQLLDLNSVEPNETIQQIVQRRENDLGRVAEEIGARADPKDLLALAAEIRSSPRMDQATKEEALIMIADAQYDQLKHLAENATPEQNEAFYKNIQPILAEKEEQIISHVGLASNIANLRYELAHNPEGQNPILALAGKMSTFVTDVGSAVGVLSDSVSGKEPRYNRAEWETKIMSLDPARYNDADKRILMYGVNAAFGLGALNGSTGQAFSDREFKAQLETLGIGTSDIPKAINNLDHQLFRVNQVAETARNSALNTHMIQAHKRIVEESPMGMAFAERLAAETDPRVAGEFNDAIANQTAIRARPEEEQVNIPVTEQPVPETEAPVELNSTQAIEAIRNNPERLNSARKAYDAILNAPNEELSFAKKAQLANELAERYGVSLDVLDQVINTGNQ